MLLPDGIPRHPRFELWDASHWAALASIVVMVALAAPLLRVAGPVEPRIRRSIFALLIATLAGAELYGQWAAVAESRWTLAENLPLHLCDLAVFMAIYTLLRGMRPQSQAAARLRMARPFELLYFWGLAGGTQALLTPELQDSFPSAAYFEFFVVHCAAVASVLILVLGVGLRPHRGSVRRSWATTVLLGLCTLPVNAAVGGNYMYTCGPPKAGSLYDYLGPWPFTLLGLAAVGWLLMSLLYLPFYIADRAVRRGATDRRPE